MRFFKQRLDEKGQSLTEYITLLVLVALVSIGAVSTLGKRVKGKIARASKKISSGISFKDVKVDKDDKGADLSDDDHDEN